MGGEEESQLADVLKHLSGIRFVYCMLILRGTEAQFVNIFRHLVKAENTVYTYSACT